MSQKKRHPSLERLLEYVKDRGVVGPSALASAMRETDQVITNWGSRGVSTMGALKAEERFGCPAVWVLKGVNPATGFKKPNTQPKNDGEQLRTLFDLIKSAEFREIAYSACFHELSKAIDASQQAANQPTGDTKPSVSLKTHTDERQ